MTKPSRQPDELLAEGSTRLRLPVDVVIADHFDAEAEKKSMPMGPVPDGWRILDIGPETVAAYGKIVDSAGTVVWNGPMGVFEFPASPRARLVLPGR